MPTGNPTPRVDPEHWTCWGCDHSLSIQELGDGCHPCELQCTSSQPVSSFMYPQGRSVHVPTGNPTPRADPGPAGGVSMANKYSRAWRWMTSL